VSVTLRNEKVYLQFYLEIKLSKKASDRYITSQVLSSSYLQEQKKRRSRIGKTNSDNIHDRVSKKGVYDKYGTKRENLSREKIK
jgi:hypothetical protein